jgi:hypothetical protein
VEKEVMEERQILVAAVHEPVGSMVVVAAHKVDLEEEERQISEPLILLVIESWWQPEVEAVVAKIAMVQVVMEEGLPDPRDSMLVLD